MPKIYEYFGFVFLFYSSDHEPVHVHVQYGEFENKVEFELKNGKIENFTFKKVNGIEQIPNSKIKDVSLFIETFGDNIIQKWIDFYVLKKKLKNEKITTKIK